MKAGQTNIDVGEKIIIKGIKGENSDLNGLTGRVTHPFAFGETKKGWIGIWLDKSKKAEKYNYQCNVKETEVKIFKCKFQREFDKKYPYCYIWIEGITPETGEKVKHFNGNNTIEYTTKITESLRIRIKDIDEVSKRLLQCGVADWVVNSPRSFVRTSYAPKGTLLKIKK